jgi:ABC-2 type transport system permease protein
MRIRAIIDKEWAEAFKNRMVLFTVGLLPLLFALLPLVIILILRNAGAEQFNSGPPPPGLLNDPAFAGLNERDLVLALLVNQFMLFYLIIPLAVPVTIAAYSVVGEKRDRSLEPLLATPITVSELLWGKSLAAAIPGILTTWLSYTLYATLARFLIENERVYATIVNPMWLFALAVVAPLMAVLAVNVGLLVSSRVNDPRAAEQLSMFVILPVLALFFARMAGLVLVNLQTMIGMAGMLVVIDVGLIWLGARVFQRETILTRWK